ncbi:MAG: response regulator [Proteobacteria bacterium]|nr:response regulator [Pseudomonadota bacterium]
MNPRPDIKRLEEMAILVVEDQDFMRGYIRQMLQTLGCKNISMATNGNAAVRHLNGPELDLILLDIHMELINGLEVLAAIRAGATHAKPYLPVIMLTGDTALEKMALAEKLKANAILAKPLSLNTLAKAIGQVFSTLRPFHPLPLNLDAIKEMIMTAEFAKTDPETRSLDYIFKSVPTKFRATQSTD